MLERARACALYTSLPLPRCRPVGTWWARRKWAQIDGRDRPTTCRGSLASRHDADDDVSLRELDTWTGARQLLALGAALVDVSAIRLDNRQNESTRRTLLRRNSIQFSRSRRRRRTSAGTDNHCATVARGPFRRRVECRVSAGGGRATCLVVGAARRIALKCAIRFQSVVAADLSEPLELCKSAKGEHVGRRLGRRAFRMRKFVVAGGGGAEQTLKSANDRRMLLRSLLPRELTNDRPNYKGAAPAASFASCRQSLRRRRTSLAARRRLRASSGALFPRAAAAAPP